MWREKYSVRMIMMWTAGLTIVFTLIVMFVADRGLPVTGRSAAPEAASPVLEAVRLSPAVDSNEEVECNSHSSVEFTYRIHNKSASSVTGLTLAQTCSCQTNGELPDTIPPGDNALITFRIKAPLAGRIQSQIPLFCNEQPIPLLVLNASLRVRLDPPALLTQSGDLQLTFVDDVGTMREIVLVTLESKKHQPWICGLEIDPEDAMEMQPSHVDELVEPDPNLTRRRYHFPVINRTLGFGAHTITVRILTNDGMPTVASPMWLDVNVIDSVTIVPDSLVIRAPNANSTLPHRLTVIRRTGEQRGVNLTYDHDLLAVKAAEPTTKMIATFEVMLTHAKSKRPAETEIVFDFGADGTRAVKVQFESHWSP